MPEIAEVARVTHFLRLHLVGKKISKVWAQDDQNVFGKVGTSGDAFMKALTGKQVVGAGTQGKYFWLLLNTPPHPVMHLGMTGWIHIRGEQTAYTRYAEKTKGDKEEWPPKFWKFHLATDSDPKVEVAFTDARRFGRIRLMDCPGEDIRKHTPLKENGPDPVVDKDIFTEDFLKQKMRSRHVPIKALLLDQATVSGIGNWVGDEIMYQAKLHPEQYCDDFSDADISTLYKAIRHVCDTAVEKLGDSDQFPEDWLFNHRWGKGKKDAATTLPNGEKFTFITVGGRTSCVVPGVQKKTGRVAADAKVESAPEENGDEGRISTDKKGSRSKRSKKEVDQHEPEEHPKKKARTSKPKTVKKEEEKPPKEEDEPATNGSQKSRRDNMKKKTVAPPHEPGRRRSAVMDEDMKGGSGEAGGSLGLGARILERSPLSKTRSLSDGDGSQLSPSPHIIEAERRTSKDDSALGRDRIQDTTTPVTPRRPDFPLRGLSLHMPRGNSPSASPSHNPTNIRPAPLSPKLDPSQIYASPTNILPRRSRGLDFSRAATSLHHSMLAEQSSPDSSPTIGGRAMNIPGRANAEYGSDQQPTSLWSMMGNQERMNISSSLGSTNHPLASDSSSSSGDDAFMDEEMEDPILGTPQVAQGNRQAHGTHAAPWMPGTSPAMNSLSSFRSRPRKQNKRKLRGLAGLGFNAAAPSPPNNAVREIRDTPISHSRRESISWAANQLQISGSESEEKTMDTSDGLPITLARDGPRGVVKRVVTRRGNLLPKTKGFARIRAALAEENTPVDSEFRREAEVIRQVRESDTDLEPRIPSGPAPLDSPNTAPSQTSQTPPNLASTQEPLDGLLPDDDMMTDSSSFKQQAMKNSKGKNFWDIFSETSSIAGSRTTPPPPAFLPRGSSSGISEDVNMDSPSLSAGSGNTSLFGLSSGLTIGNSATDIQRFETPQPTASAPPSQGSSVPPTAAEITRRINNKRRRDDDFDPHSFKRRAVSPGMSVHNSPIMQSPMQRDMAPWGSRPGSNHGADKASATPSENGSTVGSGGTATNSGRPINSAKGRIGFQGMVDTHDGLMRMSIE
ncbi:Uu.00g126430.m01.CDS01 [Anthostomella pinea]|uniref:DNA-(apurinic or apyrimidinic site) lyase n=1 Tax=Anthostomella pinea TaxID=933095 RepID=A0AAI8YHS6_9PEZI|nr:Uu.00g126430.m01.CDS01 [Anthostomella pinea]